MNLKMKNSLIYRRILQWVLTGILIFIVFSGTSKPLIAAETKVTNVTQSSLEQNEILEDGREPKEQPEILEGANGSEEQPEVSEETNEPEEQPEISEETNEPEEQPEISEETNSSEEQPEILKESIEQMERSEEIEEQGWIQKNGEWYFLVNGKKLTGWNNCYGHRYYFNEDGVMQTGWLPYEGHWYYLNKDGMMCRGWLSYGGHWYYLDSEGRMATGWNDCFGYRYYFNKDGVMQTGWVPYEGHWYYLNKDGMMCRGWLSYGGHWYYLDSEGRMATGWNDCFGYRYYFNKDGVMQTGWVPYEGHWYYLTSNGVLGRGWLSYHGEWYYLQSDGTMADSNIVINGKLNYFHSNGVWYGEQVYDLGIDVSENQGNINWQQVADSGIRFAMLRVAKGTIGNITADAFFERNYAEAAKAGIQVGVYRYCYATTPAEARTEAQKVLQILNGRTLDYPVVLDVEDSTLLNNVSSNSERSEIVLAFKQVIENGGYEFAVYANLNWLNNYLDMNKLSSSNIWIARWRELEKGHGYTGKGNVIMWQYTNSGSVGGISGKVDMNIGYIRM